MKKDTNNLANRVFARQLGRELFKSEIEQVAGGTKRDDHPSNVQGACWLTHNEKFIALDCKW